MHVEVVSIGDELLRGETVNTNATWLAGELIERGVTVARITVVPDDEDAIGAVVNAARDRVDAVITTGGLGPTHDDRTMAAVAAARDVEMTPHPDATAWVADETDRDVEDLAPDTLALPEGARFLPNAVGVAPGAVIDDIYVLPGVPDEMEAMFAHVADEFAGQTRHEAVIDVAQPESEIAPTLAKAERTFPVTVGSYPGEYVRVRVIGADATAVERAADWLRERVDRVHREKK